MAEHARFEAGPFVTLAGHRAGKQVAHPSGPQPGLELDEPPGGVPRPTRSARERQQIGVAGIDDEVALLGADAVDDSGHQLVRFDASVLERQEEAPVVADVAVTCVDNIKRRRNAARARLSHVAPEPVHRLLQLALAGRQHLGGSLRMQPARVVVQPRQHDGARAQRSEQREVASSVVVRILERRDSRLGARVDADDQREQRALPRRGRRRGRRLRSGGRRLGAARHAEQRRRQGDRLPRCHRLTSRTRWFTDQRPCGQLRRHLLCVRGISSDLLDRRHPDRPRREDRKQVQRAAAVGVADRLRQLVRSRTRRRRNRGRCRLAVSPGGVEPVDVAVLVPAEDHEIRQPAWICVRERQLVACRDRRSHQSGRSRGSMRYAQNAAAALVTPRGVGATKSAAVVRSPCRA